MKIWMDVMRDLEDLMDHHQEYFDSWLEGGVDGLVVGPLVFNSGKLLPGTRPVPAEGGPPTLTFDPNPSVYERLGVEAPPPPDCLPAQRALLDKTFQAAKDRGFQIWIFQAQTGAGPGGDGHHLWDPRSTAATCARMVDTLEHYPMADGAIMDGPEWGYEIAPHHMNRRSHIFDDLPESVAPMCAGLGYDYAALVAARDRFYQRLHELDRDVIALHCPGGMLGALQLFGGDPDLAAWLQFRIESLTAYFGRVRECLTAESSRPLKLGVGPRSAAFAPLCGYDFRRLGAIVDVLLPKHYFWQRGFDGLVGTVFRYIETLCEWNPDLSDVDAMGVVESLFGLVLPEVEDRADLERALTPEFFHLIVGQETERALAAVGDPQRMVPWVDAGRAPHDGDPMSAGDLRSLLEAAAGAGLERFLYHHHGNLTAGEWVVMSDLCGRRWDARSSQYQPPDQLVL
ncbi:hypothetical protein ACFL6X_07475 [Candidatus Latescibacterota bacterium]